MNRPEIPQSNIIFDNCCLLNLYVSSVMADMLSILDGKAIVAVDVKDDEFLLYTDALNESSEELSQRRTNVEIWITNGLLQVTDFETEPEAEMVVNLTALRLDQGEAASIAIAIHRNWAIAIDEKKGQKTLKHLAPHIPIITTPDLLYWWVETSNPSADVIRQAIHRVRSLGSYEPPKKHSLYSWWMSFQHDQP